MNQVFIDRWFPKVIYHTYVTFDDLEKQKQDIRDYMGEVDHSQTELLSVPSTHLTDGKLLTQPFMKPLQTQIHSHVKHFADVLGYGSRQLRHVNSWVNIGGENDFTFPHVHPESFISGALYLAVPQDSKITFFDDLGNMQPVANYENFYNHDLCTYDCNVGRLILFKSNLLHGVGRQKAGERMVISFNFDIVRSTEGVI